MIEVKICVCLNFVVKLLEVPFVPASFWKSRLASYDIFPSFSRKSIRTVRIVRIHRRLFWQFTAEFYVSISMTLLKYFS
jgi:hypothetical protein